MASMSVSSFGWPFGAMPFSARRNVDFVLRVPADALAAVAELFHQRADRGEARVQVRIVALHHGDVRHGAAGHRRGLAALPVLHVVRLRQFARGVVQDRGQHHVGLDAEHFRRDVGERLGDALVDVPVRARLPRRIHRRGQRMDERMHVGGVEVVLLVPGRGRQHDVGIDAGGGHAEIQRHQQVKFSFRRVVVPGDVLRLFAAFVAEVLAQHAVLGAEQVLEEILVALAGGAEQVGTPDEHVARPVRRVVGVVAGEVEVRRRGLPLPLNMTLPRPLPDLGPLRGPSPQGEGENFVTPVRRSPSLPSPPLSPARRPSAGSASAAAPMAASPCVRRARCSRSANRSSRPRAPSATESPTRSASRTATDRCAHRRTTWQFCCRGGRFQSSANAIGGQPVCGRSFSCPT